MILYGRNPVREALRGARAVTQVWATEGAAREPWLTGPGKPRVQLRTGEQLEGLCHSSAHQGLCAEASPFRYAAGEELLAHADPLLIALDEVQDPQNLGSICRSAECAGASGVVIPERRSVEVTPAVCKASAGAVEHLAVARVRNLADFLAEAKAHGCWCYGASAQGGRSLYDVDLRGGAVLVLGSEGRGLRPRVASACDELVSLPVRGRVESLNVGVAAALALYEAIRQRR